MAVVFVLAVLLLAIAAVDLATRSPRSRGVSAHARIDEALHLLDHSRPEERIDAVPAGPAGPSLDAEAPVPV